MKYGGLLNEQHVAIVGSTAIPSPEAETACQSGGARRS